jgi:hypothetical protein
MVSLTGMPPATTYGQGIQIYMAASDAALRSQPARFVGTIVEFDYTHSPHQVDVICRGWLYAAQKFQIVSGSFDFANDPYPQNGGVDLSNNGNGWPDAAIVGTILQIAQVQNYFGGINGTDKLFGSVIPESCRWAEKQSALDAIDMFDAVCLGYRTYDVPNKVVRTQISAAALSLPTNGLTFTEGVDILAGTGQYSVLATQGSFVVTGGTKKAANAPYSFTLAGSNPYTQAPEQTSSPLIEKSLAGDPGPGMSCEEVAGWRKGEMDRAVAQVQFDTPRDDYIEPGYTIRVLSDWRLGATSELYWVQRVETTLTEESVFSQKLTCVGTAL